MLRSSGVETRRAAVPTAECSKLGRLESALNVTHVPTFQPSNRCRSVSPINEITVFGSWCRRFMFGYRPLSPATNIPSGPASLFIGSASVSVFGCRYRKVGSLSMHARHGFAVAAFPWCRDARRLRPGDVGKGGRAKSSCFTLRLGSQRLEHLLWRDGHLVGTDADSVVDRICDRRDHRQQRSLANLFLPKRAVRVCALGQVRAAG